MSPFPELALPAADRLRGNYRRGIESNQEAILADDIYFARETGTVFYVVYRVHYVCAKLYSAMMSGRFADAISAAEKLEQIIDPKILAVESPPMADYIESFAGSRAHVLVRFGRWEDILKIKLPTDPKTYSVTTAIIHYARGLAFSALSRVAEAEVAQKKFEIVRAAVPVSRFNSIPCKQVDVLGVSSAMLAGEIEYRKGNFKKAFSSLREAIKREDALAYSDPPPWMQPVRHALGALLLEQSRVEEAEILFKEDLGFAEGYPRRKAKLNNVWGLHGLYGCFMRQGKTGEAAFV
ncbi:hypothetical protein IFR04_008665 [Cadophora malorum]|uniref:Tetratricopeptide repeat protein n=1 Tax=Cadophora malorum TaxID=108018 RepID=A0A8H7TG66_9HELO|nr:hypothetical protein IFR04_008665 [Cadophora malorum]